MASRRTLLLATAAIAARSTRAFINSCMIVSRPIPSSASTSKRWMGADSQTTTPPPINRIQKDVFEQIIDEYESEGREVSGYVVIDVRGDEEVAFTGKVSPNTYTLPLPLIQDGAFLLDDDDFEERFKFAKPGLEETLVFTCKAGVRSNYAAQYAWATAGYGKLFDYIGGADEWFR